MRPPPGSSGYRNPLLNSWNGNNSRNLLAMGQDGGKRDGKVLDPPLSKRQRKSQLTSACMSGPQMRLRCRTTTHDSSSTPTHRTEVGQPRCLPATHGVGQALRLPPAHGVGQARRLRVAHGVGQSWAIARPALQSFLRQIPGRRNRYNFTLHQKSHLR
jgi:hypothetical protein